MPRKVITEKERLTIVAMKDQGHTYKDIGVALGWDKDRKNYERSVAEQYRKIKHGGTKTGTAKATKTPPPTEQLLEQMDRVQRNEYLAARLRLSPRYQTIISKGLSPEERDLFEYEYSQLIKSMDSLTEAEEQMLFTALHEYVLSHRAGSIKSELERCVQETLSGMWKDGDIRFRTVVPNKYSDEQESHLKRYESLMDKLKLSRSQRLDKVKDTKKTLVDVARDLTTSEQQARVADEIERIERVTDKELKRMLASGYLYGLFGIEQGESVT